MFVARRRFCWGVVGVLLICLRPVNGQFAPAARWVPESANSLVLVQAKRILDSELSQAEGWRKDRIKAFKSGAAFLPVTTDKMLVGAELDLDNLEPKWQISVFESSGPKVNLTKFSEKAGGNLEMVNGKEALSLPNNTYVVQVDDTTLAAMTPANRQAVSRWLRGRAVGGVKLSSYLDRAVNFADANADIVVALDLEDTADEARIKKNLTNAGIVKAAEIPAVARTIAGLRGMMLGITVKGKITGALRVDFSGNAQALKPYAKALLIEALSRRGLMIDDIEGWELTQNEQSCLLSGPLSISGMRLVLSMVRHAVEIDEDSSSPGDATEEPNMATLSKQYFNQIESIYEDLRKVRANSLNIYASYFERYARELDQLSVVGVDPDLVKFGGYVSDNFRDVAGVLRNSQFTRRSVQAGMPDTYYRETYGAFGDYSYYIDNTRARQAAGVQQDVQGEGEARDILRDVGKQFGEVRRALGEKYQLDF